LAVSEMRMSLDFRECVSKGRPERSWAFFQKALCIAGLNVRLNHDSSSSIFKSILSMYSSADLDRFLARSLASTGCKARHPCLSAEVAAFLTARGPRSHRVQPLPLPLDCSRAYVIQGYSAFPSFSSCTDEAEGLKPDMAGSDWSASKASNIPRDYEPLGRSSVT
jgi:hypothetical protein